jgi:hypothetical protein
LFGHIPPRRPASRLDADPKRPVRLINNARIRLLLP